MTIIRNNKGILFNISKIEQIIEILKKEKEKSKVKLEKEDLNSVA